MKQIIRAWMFTVMVVSLAANITVAHATDNFALVSRNCPVKSSFQVANKI